MSRKLMMCERVFVLLCCSSFLAGCTSICAIRGVSSQNLRNAQAIDKNIEALISVSDMSVKFTVNRIWVQDNVTLIDNLLNERRSYKQASDPGKTLRTKLDDEAKRLMAVTEEALYRGIKVN